MQWESPLETGGVSISTYTVTVEREGMMVSQNVSGNMLTHNIPGLEYNTDYEVEVTTINSCGIPSQPATTTVSIDARGQWNIHRPHGIFTVLTFLSSSTSAQTTPSSPLLWCSSEKWQTSCHQLDGGPLLCTVAITSLKYQQHENNTHVCLWLCVSSMERGLRVWCIQ